MALYGFQGSVEFVRTEFNCLSINTYSGILIAMSAASRLTMNRPYCHSQQSTTVVDRILGSLGTLAIVMERDLEPDEPLRQRPMQDKLVHTRQTSDPSPQ